MRGGPGAPSQLNIGYRIRSGRATTGPSGLKGNATMTLTKAEINARRQASLSAKQNGQVAGVNTFEDDAQLVHRENLVGTELAIDSDGIRANLETKNGPATLIYATRVSDGAEIKFWAGRPIESQLGRIDSDTLADFLWTIAERHYTDKRGIAQLGYFLDYSDGDAVATNGNTAAINRGRVAAEKSKAQASRQSSDEDEDEEISERHYTDRRDAGAVAELTAGQFAQLSPAKQIAFMRNLQAGTARLVEAPTTPLQRAAQKALDQKTTAKKTAPAEPADEGQIITFGVGSHELGRGRRPSTVKEVLASGQNVYYSRKNGVFYADDKRTVIYQKPE